MKTEVCNFSGYKIHPGKGIRFIRGDCRVFVFLSNKCEASFHMRRNPRKITWTQIYRRVHKKGTLEETQKKKARKTQKVQRAIVGATLEVIKAKRNQKPEQRAAQRESALREIKEKKKAETKAKKELKEKIKTGGKPAAKQPKQSKPAQRGARPKSGR